MMWHSVALLMFRIASAQQQQSVSIADMLAEPNSRLHTPSGRTQDEYQSGPAGSDKASIGSLLGQQRNQPAVDPEYEPAVNTDSQLPVNPWSAMAKSSYRSGGKKGVSAESQEIVAGIVEAFMHKQSLLPGEKTCLENSISQLSADVVGTVKDVVDAIKSLIPQQPSQPGYPPVQPKPVGKGNLVTEGIDGALKITSLVTLSTTLIKNCVQGDALRMLNETAHHLIDLKYLGHRFVVSGVDVAHFLSDSIIAFEGHRYHRFGRDIGTALRKVLLSNSNRGAKLPEGVPEETIIQQVSEGVMEGFFVGGSEVRITDRVRPDVDIDLNLHTCIAGNQPFFKEIFLALWNAIAQFSLNIGKHGLGSGQAGMASSSGTPQWTGELMVALMQLPAALDKCDVDADTQSMLMEAIQTLPELKVQVEFPAARARVDEITKRMAKAVEDWTDWEFDDFGKELGKMLREFVLLVLPQKYAVDSNGRLRRQLSSSAGHRLTTASAALIGGIGLLSIGLLAARAARSAHVHARVGETDPDPELASKEFLREELAE
jgi:hypothetical protein